MDSDCLKVWMIRDELILDIPEYRLVVVVVFFVSGKSYEVMFFSTLDLCFSKEHVYSEV